MATENSKGTVDKMTKTTNSPNKQSSTNKSTKKPSQTKKSDDISEFPPELIKNPEKCLRYISKALDETDEKPVRQLQLIIESIKTKKALKLLKKTVQIEKDGGLFIYNNARRRTLGGIYFFLAQRWVKKTHRPLIWPEMYPNHSCLEWEERQSVIEKALNQAGEAKTPRLVLIGRPGRIIEKGRVVLTSMQREKRPTSWPKGLPPLPQDEGPYIVYISIKQWRKVKQSIRNKKDELIIEGYPKFNAKLNAITVFAMRTTTKLLEQTRREKQRSDAALKSRKIS